MPWKQLPDVENGDLPTDFTSKIPFLLDEGIGPEVAQYLKGRGYNAAYAGDVGLAAHSDEDIVGYAWTERRVLLTHDHDFLDHAKFPEHRYPGIIVLAGGSGDNQAMGTAVATLILVFRKALRVWEASKITMSADGFMTIRNRDHLTGQLKTSHHRSGGPQNCVGSGGSLPPLPRGRTSVSQTGCRPQRRHIGSLRLVAIPPVCALRATALDRSRLSKTSAFGRSNRDYCVAAASPLPNFYRCR